jgi:hypothetical protein
VGRREAAACPRLRFNRRHRRERALDLQPSTATTIAHGFATIARFFPGNRAELAAIDDESWRRCSGLRTRQGASRSRINTSAPGGQLFELMAGHDRFVADLRPLFERRRPGGAALCCHPYDLCTELIARELGCP